MFGRKGRNRIEHIFYTPRRCSYYDVVVGLVWSNDPEN